LDGLARWPNYAFAAPYAGDALFVKGQRSRYIKSTHLRDLSALFPNFTLQSVKDAGHWLHADQPEASCDVARKFLDR